MSGGGVAMRQQGTATGVSAGLAQAQALRLYQGGTATGVSMGIAPTQMQRRHQKLTRASLRDLPSQVFELLDASLFELQTDCGTRALPVIRVDDQPSGAFFVRLLRDTGVELETRPRTRMGRIRALAPLALRQWAEVFHVSHSAIRDWEKQETERDKLDQVLELMREAGTRRSDLSAWLVQDVPSLGVRPLDLLAADRWRAFRGAMRIQPSEVSITPEELRRRHQESLDRAMTDAPTVPDAE